MGQHASATPGLGHATDSTDGVCPGCGGYRAAVASGAPGVGVAVTGPEHQDLDDGELLDVARREMSGRSYTDPATGEHLSPDTLIVDLWTPPNWTPTGQCP